MNLIDSEADRARHAEYRTSGMAEPIPWTILSDDLKQHWRDKVVWPLVTQLCQLLDDIDCCPGYSIKDEDLPKFWTAQEMARDILRKEDA